MSCVEKRHMSHRAGSMLHHRFPNGFTDLFMDETDREVSTLTDRAFRSLCIGDDAVYNDEFSYGYSPFSCHKPLVGEPVKKTIKESKKHGQSRRDKNESQPWKQQQQKNMSQMSSFLKALSATEDSCGGMFQKNGVVDSNGESWDKSALRSIQRELSEFSADYHTSLTDGLYKKQQQHPSGDVSSNKMGKDHSSGKSSKNKNGKTNVKIKKLNIKNFFLHSDLSPFQAWKDLNRFHFAQESIVASILPEDPVPKWYDLSFYKELTEAHMKETEEADPCQKAIVEPPPPPPHPPAEPKPKPIPPPVPPKVLPKPLLTLTAAEKRCLSEGGEGTAAPWRRNRSRATSAVPGSQPGISTQGNSTKHVDENLLLLKNVDESLSLLRKVDENLLKKEARSVEVKTVAEVNSLASTPFSICQLMTPIIPSRQATDTSEILSVLSPSSLDLPLQPQSEAKVTPEPPLKRDSYKSLASSILFNLKDNRKRVKSRYSPPKFKTLEESEGGSPQSDQVKQTFPEGLASDMSTPVLVKDVAAVCSPLSEMNSQSVDFAKHGAQSPLSDDYLLSHLLQSIREADTNQMSPLIHAKKNKSPLAKKQNYPSLNLYKKASPVDSGMKYLQVPLSLGASVHTESEKIYLSPPPLDKEFSPTSLPKTAGLSPDTLNVSKSLSTVIPSPAFVKEGPTLQAKEVKKPPVVPNQKNSMEAVSLKENYVTNQPTSAVTVMKAAREAIHAAQTKALSAAEAMNKPTDGTDREEEKEEKSQVFATSRNEENNADNTNSDKKKEPPPVPKRNFSKSDIQLPLDNAGRLSSGEPENSTEPKSKESSQRQGKLKHIFSARQNNYIKNQRYALSDDEQEGGAEESDLKVSASTEDENESVARREMRDSEHIISDLNALKELERARLADRIQENAKNKSGVVDIVEQTKARNDLISRELRNIKKGMMSMRGNTMAKREKFTKKENEQSKGKVYTKIDGNVIVNKAVINDNYDKAKMALEEIISERERRKNGTEQETVSDESYDKFQKHKDTEADVKSTGPNLTDLKERLGDLRDHNHMRQILSQTEPGLGETHRAGGQIALPGMDRTSNELNALLKVKSNTIETLINNYLDDSKQVYSGHVPEDTLEMIVDQNKDRKQSAPPIPPRSRKGGSRRDSVTKETDVTNDVVEEDNKNDQCNLCLRSETKDISSGKQKVKESNETVPSESKTNLDKAINANSKATKSSDSVPSESLLTKSSQLENRLYLSPEARTNENKKDTISHMTEVAPESNIQTKGTGKVKRTAPLRPARLNSPAPDKPDKTITANEDSKLDFDFLVESPKIIISPLLLVNGQSPPDQASLSSKSSYFSAESALHRNTETESNVYHSLENLIGEVEEVDEVRNASQNTKNDSERTETEYYSFSDHESEPEPAKRQIKSPQKEPEALCKEAKETDKSTEESKVTDEKKDPTPSATSNPVSPTLAIPALFKVKDNTFSNKLKKIRQPWSPRGSLAGVESLQLDQLNNNLEPTVSHQSHSNDIIPVPSEGSKEVEVEIPPKSSSPLLILPTSPPSEKLKVQQDEGFLTVPQQDDRNSGVSPLSEGVESTATSTVDTGDETGINSGIELEVSKVPSERSGSTCSGNDSQTGLTKPPVVLPKSEKAVLKAIKLTNRRIKKEEAQKSAHKTSHSSGKHKSDRHKSDKSLHKSTSSDRNPKSSERKHREKTDTSHYNVEENTTDFSHNNQQRADTIQTNCRQSVESGEITSHRNSTALANERQGRSSDRQVRDRPDQRHYSSDRIISNVPVYKAHVGENPRSDRLFRRSLSTDRYTENKVERRLSADVSVNDRPDLRSQRIEKSIMDEFQQRGRQRDKPSKDNPLRRSHSIDSQSANVLHPANLSRQSSLTSQLSRQSSIEHTIVTQSFPIAQRKLLQDPDSGQYFFVDMPLQVKTKTFFDPQTGSYVQLPVQPPEGALPQASPMEVLSPPLVVYHGFVPVPLSPMAQKAPIQAPRIEHEEFDPRHLERVLTRHTDGHSYMEPVFGQHEHMLGEFLGTEELDCPS